MAPLDDTTPATRFDSYNVYRTSYKKIHNHEIEVGILVPKNLKPGKIPLLVKFHGGGLITGTALFPDWFSAWFVPFTQRNNAITILPNYRLVPEHSGDDILEDLADFWTWYNDGGVEKFLSSQNVNIELDYDRLLVSGESAGGYVALQAGLTRPKGDIKAILVQYPMTNYPRRKATETLLSMPSPPPSFIDEHMASVKPGTVVSSAVFPARVELIYGLGVYGRYNEFFGTGKHLWPITAIEDAKSFPPTFILHGEQDTSVKIEDSRAFVKKAKDVIPDAEIKLAVREGDHGFDGELKEDEEEWLKEGLQWIEGKWLA
ncbi:Alpha/Beta hydrolase protein [Phaeosphaeriaceae sp. PMI808]|nr:Alpha/Beta hydrolase protein [Phaeosphaeriaceae sp. PMI808]